MTGPPVLPQIVEAPTVKAVAPVPLRFLFSDCDAGIAGALSPRVHKPAATATLSLLGPCLLPKIT